MFAAAAVAAIAVALAAWVVPAFSGGTSGQWTWVSGPVFQDNAPDFGTAVMTAYNGGAQPADVTVRGINPNGTNAAPTLAATATIPAGETRQWSWDCSTGFGCLRTFELTTASQDVVPSVIFDTVETTGLTYTGLVPPGGFIVFGPNGASAAAGVQAIAGATAAVQADTAQLRADSTAVKSDTTTVKSDTAQLRRTLKKVRKQLKKIQRAVR